MLLAIDIGNSHSVIGVLQPEGGMKHCWRVSTDPRRTSDEIWLLLDGLARSGDLDLGRVDGVILASVVPPLTPTWAEMARQRFGVDALVVGVGVRTGMPILVENPREVGADRIVNAVAAYSLTGQATIIVDLGTAVTFDVVDDQGRYTGGAIGPGIGLGLEALFRGTAKLPRVDLVAPDRAIGRNTVESIQSGTFFGAVAMVDGMVDRFRDELDDDEVVVLATGGQAALVAAASRNIDRVEPDLTLHGLRIIYERNT